MRDARISLLMEAYMPREYQVIYRTGGTDNFKWHIVGEIYRSSLLAYDKRNELVKMGYRAIVHDADRLSVIGLPETFE